MTVIPAKEGINRSVMPAQAGIQPSYSWMPACAGMTLRLIPSLAGTAGHMRKLFLFIFLVSSQITANAADLLVVAQQALFSDPTYQQAIAQRLVTKENLPIAISSLLPNLSATANPSVTRTGYTGANLQDQFYPRNNTQRAYTLRLTATQTVFNFAQFAQVAGSLATSRGADASLNAALQDLIIRVANAYFAVLQDEDNLSYSEAAKIAYAEQLDQAKQQYNVGLKTITDVYTAQASYESYYAKYISDQASLANDKENLRAITGKYYPDLSSLREDFPLITPEPVDIEQWVKKALEQNWSIKASLYTADSARQNIRQQFGGHLPTVSAQGTIDRIYSDNISSANSFGDRAGSGTQSDRAIMLNLNLPIFSGGSVIAQTNQASYQYQVAQQQLEQTVRTTISNARKSYLNVRSGITQIIADKQAIKSNRSSLEGMEESYRVGTETLVNVLDQQQKLFQAQTEYAKDRYAFVNNILALKQAAGTLSFDDLRAINMWLAEKQHVRAQRKSLRVRRHHHKKN